MLNTDIPGGDWKLGKALEPLDVRQYPTEDKPVDADCSTPVAVVPAHIGA